MTSLHKIILITVRLTEAQAELGILLSWLALAIYSFSKPCNMGISRCFFCKVRRECLSVGRTSRLIHPKLVLKKFN